jgi:DNA-directed RNA polymerase specialized sigma24 family protein
LPDQTGCRTDLRGPQASNLGNFNGVPLRDHAVRVALYDKYADRLYDYARSLLLPQDADRAMDVVRDTFAQAFTSLTDDQDLEAALPWLYVVVREYSHRLMETPPHARPGDDDARRFADLDREIRYLVLRHGLAESMVGVVVTGEEPTDVLLADVRRSLHGLADAPREPLDLVPAPAAIRNALFPGLGTRDTEVLATASTATYQNTQGRHAAPREAKRTWPWWMAAVMAVIAGSVVAARALPGSAPHTSPEPSPTPQVLVTGLQPTLLPVDPSTSGPRTASNTPSPSSTPTSSAPTSSLTTAAPSPTTRPTGPPKPTPTPTPTLTRSPTPTTQGPLVFSVTPTVLHLSRASVGTVRLKATGGTVSWTASSIGPDSQYLYVLDRSGTLADGETDNIEVDLDPNTPDDVTTLQCVVNPGNHVVTVTVS